MKFRYSKRYIRDRLYLGVVYFIVGVLFLFSEVSNRSSMIMFIVSTIFLVHFFYIRNHDYIILEGGILQVNSLFRLRRLEILNVREVKLSKYKIVLVSNDLRKFNIWIWLAEPEAKQKLLTEVEKIILAKK